jgi:hypothetical protein
VVEVKTQQRLSNVPARGPLAKTIAGPLKSLNAVAVENEKIANDKNSKASACFHVSECAKCVNNRE